MGGHQGLMDVGPQSTVGGLLRRGWLPFLPAGVLEERQVLPVRLLGESLVCYRDGRGKIGLLDEFCGHQSVSLKWGYPDANGLRCAYHDWCYDEGGQCVEMPLGYGVVEDERITAYPVRQLGELLFAGLGSSLAPMPLVAPPPDLGLVAIHYSVTGRHWLRLLTEAPVDEYRQIEFLPWPHLERRGHGGTAVVDLIPIDVAHTLRIERRYGLSSAVSSREAISPRYLSGDLASSDYWNAVDLAGARGRAYPSEPPECGCTPGTPASSFHDLVAKVLGKVAAPVSNVTGNVS